MQGSTFWYCFSFMERVDIIYLEGHKDLSCVLGISMMPLQSANVNRPRML
jgi:hypothetical protein